MTLEKELKELREKAKKEEPDGDSGLMGSGLGGRLMIGGPTYVSLLGFFPASALMMRRAGGGGPYMGNGLPNGGGMMAQQTGFY